MPTNLYLDDYLNSFLVVSPASIHVFSVSPDTYVLLEHWDAPFALRALVQDQAA